MACVIDFAMGCILVLLTIVPAWAMDIVRNGRAGCVIVVPDQTFPVVRGAAEEFQYHVKESTGVLLEIVPEGGFSGKGSAVYIGATKAARAGRDRRR